MRKYILVINHPKLASTAYHRYDIHVEAFSDSLEELQNWFEQNKSELNETFPGFTWDFFQKIENET